MSDEKIVKEIEDIKEQDLIPNPPKVNGKMMYYLVIMGILLAILSAMAVIFLEGGKDNDREILPPENESVKYII